MAHSRNSQQKHLDRSLFQGSDLRIHKTDQTVGHPCSYSVLEWHASYPPECSNYNQNIITIIVNDYEDISSKMKTTDAK